MEEQSTIVVLNDGETYTNITGCSIVTLSEKGLTLLEEGYLPRQLSEDDVLAWEDLEEKVQ